MGYLTRKGKGMIEKLKEIKKSTIVRAILLIIVIVNMIASKATGKELFFIDETKVTEAVETIIAIATIVVGYWKNNSFSKYAIAADDVLKSIKKSNQTVEESEDKIEVYHYYDEESEETDDEG